MSFNYTGQFRYPSFPLKIIYTRHSQCEHEPGFDYGLGLDFIFPNFVIGLKTKILFIQREKLKSLRFFFQNLYYVFFRIFKKRFLNP